MLYNQSMYAKLLQQQQQITHNYYDNFHNKQKISNNLSQQIQSDLPWQSLSHRGHMSVETVDHENL